MKELNAAHGYTEGSDIPTEQEIKAYLNYEDVQKELETAKEIIKELIPIAEAGAIMQEHFIIDRAKQFLK